MSDPNVYDQDSALHFLLVQAAKSTDPVVSQGAQRQLEALWCANEDLRPVEIPRTAADPAAAYVTYSCGDRAVKDGNKPIPDHCPEHGNAIVGSGTYPKLLSDRASSRPDVLVHNVDEEVKARADGFRTEVPAPPMVGIVKPPVQTGPLGNQPHPPAPSGTVTSANAGSAISKPVA